MDNLATVDANHAFGIAGGQHIPVSMKILSGVLNQPKFLPLRYMSGGLSFEFELVSDATDPLITADGTIFTTTNTTDSWEIENCQIKADVLTLDNSLENSYHEHVMSGKPLPINYNTFITSNQAVSGQNISISVSRAVTRLKGLFLTFYKVRGADEDHWEKPWSRMYHPMVNVAGQAYDPGYELEYQIQLGAKLYPEYPVRSLSEAFAQLRKTVGLNYGHHAVDLNSLQYRTNKFIVGVDMEKISEMGFTGENTMNGQLLVIKVSPLNKSTLTDDKMPTQMNMYLNSDQIMEIKDVGVTVLD